MFFGDNNPAEQLSEEELRNKYHIDVEFSEKPLAIIVNKND